MAAKQTKSATLVMQPSPIEKWNPTNRQGASTFRQAYLVQEACLGHVTQGCVASLSHWQGFLVQCCLCQLFPVCMRLRGELQKLQGRQGAKQVLQSEQGQQQQQRQQ